MIKRLQLFRTDCTDPHRNLAVEQALLEAVGEDTCILYLWQNRHTVVIGRNQNAWRECRTGQMETDGVFLARRLSGGGAVFHDLGNLNFTFLVRKPGYDLNRQLGVIVEACRLMGIPAERSGRNDVLTGGRKFSGNAFYEHQGRCYHHGTLLVDVDMAAMGRYLSPSKAKLEAKGVSSVRSRVVNLKELRPDLTIEETAARMEEAFQSVYGMGAERLETSALDGACVDALTERNRSWDWLYGRDIPCELRCGKRFPWGEVELRLEVEAGTVRGVTVYTDAMDWALAPAVEGALTGSVFRREELVRRLEGADLEQTVGTDLRSLLMEQDI